eukprot:767442-Hanusia_phi.AAC.1
MANERQNIFNSLSRIVRKDAACQAIQATWVDIRVDAGDDEIEADCSLFKSRCNELKGRLEQELQVIDRRYASFQFKDPSFKATFPEKCEALGCVAGLFVIDDPRAADIQTAISTAFRHELNQVVFPRSRSITGQIDAIRLSSSCQVLTGIALPEVTKLPDAGIPPEDDILLQSAYGRANQFVVLKKHHTPDETKLLLLFARHFFGRLIIFKTLPEAERYFRDSVQAGDMLVALSKPTQVLMWDGSFAIGSTELETRMGIVEKHASAQYKQLKEQSEQVKDIERQLQVKGGGGEGRGGGAEERRRRGGKEEGREYSNTAAQDISRSCVNLRESKRRLEELKLQTPTRGREELSEDRMSACKTRRRRREEMEVTNKTRMLNDLTVVGGAGEQHERQTVEASQVVVDDESLTDVNDTQRH